MTQIDNSADILDVRDIIERIEGLRDEADALQPDEAGELSELEELLGQFAGYGGDHQWGGDWYPVTLIRDSYFETAMDELLEDIGDIPRDLPSYLSVTVDYTALQMDYTSGEFDGVTYWGR